MRWVSLFQQLRRRDPDVAELMLCAVSFLAGELDLSDIELAALRRRARAIAPRLLPMLDRGLVAP